MSQIDVLTTKSALSTAKPRPSTRLHSKRSVNQHRPAKRDSEKSPEDVPLDPHDLTQRLYLVLAEQAKRQSEKDKRRQQQSDVARPVQGVREAVVVEDRKTDRESGRVAHGQATSNGRPEARSTKTARQSSQTSKKTTSPGVSAQDLARALEKCIASTSSGSIACTQQKKQPRPQSLLARLPSYVVQHSSSRTRETDSLQKDSSNQPIQHRDSSTRLKQASPPAPPQVHSSRSKPPFKAGSASESTSATPLERLEPAKRLSRALTKSKSIVISNHSPSSDRTAPLLTAGSANSQSKPSCYVPQHASEQFARTATASGIREKHLDAAAFAKLKSKRARDGPRDTHGTRAKSGTRRVTPAELGLELARKEAEGHNERPMNGTAVTSANNAVHNRSISMDDGTLPQPQPQLPAMPKEHTFGAEVAAIRRKPSTKVTRPRNNSTISEPGSDIPGRRSINLLADTGLKDVAEESPLDAILVIDEHQRPDWSQSDELLGSGPTTPKGVKAKMDSLLKGRLSRGIKHSPEDKEKKAGTGVDGGGGGRSGTGSAGGHGSDGEGTVDKSNVLKSQKSGFLSRFKI